MNKVKILFELADGTDVASLKIHYGPSIMSQKEASRKPPGSPRRGIPGGFLSKLLKSPVFPANFKKEVR